MNQELLKVMAFVLTVFGLFYLLSFVPQAAEQARRLETMATSTIGYHEQILIDDGYTDVQCGSRPLFGCSDDDNFWYNRSCTAKNEGGKELHFTICCGLLKSCTIRRN